MSPTQTISERPKNLTGLLPIINRWKFHILVLTLLALIISTIVAMVLPNVYKSTTVFYPTNLAGLDPDRIVEGSRIEVFGTNEDVDRIKTIGMSQPLAEYIINKYKLYQDYKFESMEDDLSKQAVLDMFSSNLTIVQNERDAIELTFYSEDKIKAAAVANDMVEQIDNFNQQLTLENRKKILDIHQARFEYISNVYKKVQDSLNQARRKYGVYGLEREGQSLSKRIIDNQSDLLQAKGEYEILKNSLSASDPRVVALKARINGLEKANSSLTQNSGGTGYNLQSFSQGYDEITGLELQFADLRARFNDALKSYDNAKVALTGKISTIYVVQKAFPAMRKAKPIRWLIVVGSTLLTLILSIVFVSLLELYKNEMRRTTV